MPLGVGPWSTAVAYANAMVSMCALMRLWAWCAGCYTILEQPLGSLMGLHPRIRQLQIMIPSFKHFTTHMGAFGGPVPKPTNLYCDAPYAYKLIRTPMLADKARFHKENLEMMKRDPITGALSGGKDMKGSQEYPQGYGEAVASSYKNHVDTVADEVASSESSSDEEDSVELDSWADAGLGEVCAWVGLPSNTMAM